MLNIGADFRNYLKNDDRRYIEQATITARDIIPENFNSAKAMYALIERLQDE